MKSLNQIRIEEAEAEREDRNMRENFTRIRDERNMFVRRFDEDQRTIRALREELAEAKDCKVKIYKEHDNLRASWECEVNDRMIHQKRNYAALKLLRSIEDVAMVPEDETDTADYQERLERVLSLVKDAIRASTCDEERLAPCSEIVNGVRVIPPFQSVRNTERGNN